MDDERIFENKNNEHLDDFLKNNYPEILNAINREGYNIEFMEFDIFYEIHFENKSVGFIVFKKIPLTDNQFAIMDTYIIPEYRGNNLFFDNLSFLLIFDNFEYYPRKPTKAFINVLLKNDYAFELTSDFVVSYFKFIVDIDHEVYKNSKIKRFYKKPVGLFPYKANLFDMNLCSVMFRDPVLELVKYSDFFALTEPRKYDFKKYKCRKKLKRVTEKYIDDKFQIWDIKADEIEDFIQRKDNELAVEFSVENMIGSEDKLTESFTQKLKAFDLSMDDGFKIRNHVIGKIESGELNEKSYYQRVLYLLGDFEAIDKEIGEFDETVEVCSFCGQDIPDFARSCLKCGLHIREIDFEQHTVDKLNDTMEKLFTDFAEYLKSDVFDEPAAIEDDDEMMELKWFFNEHMLDYDFDEFLAFYKSADKNLSIEQIKDIFLEDKLNNSLGTKEEFSTYFTYLVHYFYYNEHIGKYDDAFIKLVQMAILASNKAKDKNKILESTPHSADVLFAVEDMEALDYSFDVSKLFDEAVKTFRIRKYNKHHGRVLKELHEIFD